jgi:putative FmdB family regulatory protein
MPFYEYECASCKFYTEVMQKISDTPLKKCPSCGKATLKKLVSAPVFRLKGGGWYETDFKSDQEGRRNLAGGADDAADSKASEGTTPADTKATDGKAGDAKPGQSKSGDSKPKATPAEAAGTGKSKARKAPKAAAKPASRPAARAAARKAAPRAKARAGKRRGR